MMKYVKATFPRMLCVSKVYLLLDLLMYVLWQENCETGVKFVVGILKLGP